MDFNIKNIKSFKTKLVTDDESYEMWLKYIIKFQNGTELEIENKDNLNKQIVDRLKELKGK